ncbi:Rv3654c family TadE-like protein [Humibacter sp. RRB41]|uniref:Rv3654c family TadE-like protein n=1 Tax=Humibacter sp. RRB41 TaxID=2919946 RepID=UPI001FAAF6DC|nr:Rv3654c family TadE-like protein [Humibacter sp. RRB41]
MTGRAVACTAGRDERGSATVAVVGLLAALLVVSLAAIGVCGLLAAKQHVAAAADTAALAAADAVSGRVSGYPCDRAGRAAALNGATLASCTIDGLDAVVSASWTVAGVPITVWARAGPPSAR